MCVTCDSYDVIGAVNMGYEITDSVVSPAGDLYVTGFDASRNAAVTWWCGVQSGVFVFTGGHYFTNPAGKHNYERAVGNMYDRAGYVS